jgi:hypothetical protein
MDLKEVCCEDVITIEMAQESPLVGFYDSGDEPFVP